MSTQAATITTPAPTWWMRACTQPRSQMSSPATAPELGYQVLVATAGRSKLRAVPRHVHVADYLPAHLAARRAAVVVSNGGSTTGYQALAEGRPILGIAANLDQ